MMGEDVILRIKNPPYGSNFWNGLMSAKAHVLKHVKWELGDGRSVFMWDDLWYKQSSLIQIPQYREASRWAKMHQSEYVLNYYDLSTKKWLFIKPSDENIQK